MTDTKDSRGVLTPAQKAFEQHYRAKGWPDSYFIPHSGGRIEYGRSATQDTWEGWRDCSRVAAAPEANAVEQAHDEREALIEVLKNEQNNLASSRRKCGEFEGARWDALQRVIDYLSQVMTERDAYHDMADKLAVGIATHFCVAIGDHSSANCPWTNALVWLTSPPAAHGRCWNCGHANHPGSRVNLAPSTMQQAGEGLTDADRQIIRSALHEYQYRALDAAKKEGITEESRARLLGWAKRAEELKALLAINLHSATAEGAHVG